MKNKRLFIMLAVLTSLLAIPLVAMQFTTVDWNGFDFLIMGILLLSTGLIFELVLRRVKSVKGRVVFITVVLLLFILVWAELAVGIFNSPFAGS